MARGEVFQLDAAGFIGRGRRRRCYRLPDQTGLCVKFYHIPAELPPGTRLSIQLEILICRFWRQLNINHQEYRYLSYLRRHAPPEISAPFPESMEPIYCRQRGWGTIQSIISNYDGTLARPLTKELQELTDVRLAQRIYTQTATLLELFSDRAIRFFDHPNLLLQWLDHDTYRLRIVDFEPSCRALIPGLKYLPFYVRLKARRRSRRFLATLQEILKRQAAGAAAQQQQAR